MWSGVGEIEGLERASRHASEERKREKEKGRKGQENVGFGSLSLISYYAFK